MIALTQTSPRTDVTRPFGVILLLALIAMGLSACGGGSSVPPGSTNTNYGELNTKGNVTTTQPEARRRPENSKSRTTTAAIPFKPVPNASLKGLSEPEVEAKIGEPEMIRGEGDIRVWQYRSDQCSRECGAEISRSRFRIVWIRWSKRISHAADTCRSILVV